MALADIRISVRDFRLLVYFSCKAYETLARCRYFFKALYPLLASLEKYNELAWRLFRFELMFY